MFDTSMLNGLLRQLHVHQRLTQHMASRYPPLALVVSAWFISRCRLLVLLRIPRDWLFGILHLLSGMRVCAWSIDSILICISFSKEALTFEWLTCLAIANRWTNISWWRLLAVPTSITSSFSLFAAVCLWQMLKRSFLACLLLCLWIYVFLHFDLLMQRYLTLTLKVQRCQWFALIYAFLLQFPALLSSAS